MRWARIRTVVRRVWVTAGLSFTAWMVWTFQSHGVPRAISESDGRVTVDHVDGSWRFDPVATQGKAGLAFLPGGMVDPEAYFPLARSLAERGHPVVVVALPYRVAPSAGSEAEVLSRARIASQQMHSAVPWVLAGHSRGAAIATRLVASEPRAFQGLALIGTTHPRVDLTMLTVPVLKIGGTSDCVAPRDRAEAAVGLLPSQTEWRWIEGANHAQFGWYGSQLGDCRATISREEQQAELRGILIDLLEAILTPRGADPRPRT